VRDERHQWMPTSGNKAHTMLRMKPMISREQAYNDALSYLTADQQAEAGRLFRAPGYKPRLPGAATK
jgi:hypothetical protein